jgi:hypothetical protein
VATLKNLKSKIYFFICLTLCLLHDSMCYFIVVLSSLLFYSVDNSKNKEKPLNESMYKLLTGIVYTVSVKCTVEVGHLHTP